MIRIRTSDQIEDLADVLADGIYRNSSSDPLVPVTVIIPNRETARWLALHISEREGVAANLKWTLPSEWMWEKIRNLYPDLPTILPSDIGPMRWSLYEVLGDQGVAEQFPELSRYLLAGIEEKSERRRWSLAGEMASLFDQYLVYRPWMIRNWEKGESVQGGRDEEWQKELWKILSKKWKTLGSNEIHYNRAALYEKLFRELKAGNSELSGEGMLHIFNPGLLSRPALDLFALLQSRQEITIYLIRSSSADAAGSVGSGIVSSMGGEQADIRELIREYIPEADIAPALSESNRMERPGGAGEAAPRAEPDEPKTNVERIQTSIRMNVPIPKLRQMDHSVDIRSCHSTLREVEVLYDRLQELFSEGSPLPGLSPDEVLVVTPDLDRYAPFIEGLFGTKEEGRIQIPFHLPGRFHKSGRIAPFLHLLEMPGSRFAFSDMMEFVRHRPVADQFRFSESDLRQLREWFRENRVWWGLSGVHRSEFGQPPEELHTWNHAFRRGWLGQVAGGEPGEFQKDTLLFPGISGREEQELWSRFSYLMRLLRQTTREASEQRGCREWAEVLRHWMKRFFPDSDGRGGMPDLVVSVIEQLERESAIAGVEGEIPFSVIRQYLQSAFEEGSAGAALFSRGVVFSSMVPVRSIPFRVIALLGLNDDLFPRKPVKPEFDLMARNPQRGERDRKREDRNLFLESIMAAGDLHYCSYIGRSQMDDEPIPPSPVLAEWIDLLSQSVETGRSGSEQGDSLKNGADVVIQERLHGFSEAYFVKPDLARPAPADRRRSETGTSRSWYEIAVALQRQSGVNGLSVTNPIPPEDNSNRILSVNQLEEFYKHSVACFLRQRLGISSVAASAERSEFTFGILERHFLFQRMFGWFLDGMSRERVRNVVAASGRMPSGYPGEQFLDDVSDAASLAVGEVSGRFGSARRSVYPTDLTLDGVRIRGDILSWAEGEPVFVTPSKCSGKYLLPFWIDHLLLSATHSQPLASWCLFGVRDRKPEWRRFRTVENPEEELRTLLKLYNEGLTRPLPIFPKTAFAYYEALAEKGDADKAHRAAVQAWEGGYHGYGEREDDFYKLLYGDHAELKGELLEEFFRHSESVLQPLAEHLEVPE